MVFGRHSYVFFPLVFGFINGSFHSHGGSPRFMENSNEEWKLGVTHIGNLHLLFSSSNTHGGFLKYGVPLNHSVFFVCFSIINFPFWGIPAMERGQPTSMDRFACKFQLIIIIIIFSIAINHQRVARGPTFQVSC